MTWQQNQCHHQHCSWAARAPGWEPALQPLFRWVFLLIAQVIYLFFEMQKLPSHQALAVPHQAPCAKPQSPSHRPACDSLTALALGANWQWWLHLQGKRSSTASF